MYNENEMKFRREVTLLNSNFIGDAGVYSLNYLSQIEENATDYFFFDDDSDKTLNNNEKCSSRLISVKSKKDQRVIRFAFLNLTLREKRSFF